MSRIRTIKADGDVVDRFEYMLREDGTWNDALKKSIEHRFCLGKIVSILDNEKLNDSEKLEYICNVMEKY